MALIKPIANYGGEFSVIASGDAIETSAGGTGLTSYTAGNYLRALNSSILEERTPSQVRTDIGALAASSYTASDVLTKLLTVDGTTSGLDADLLDGQHGSFYQNAGNLNAGTLLAARMPALTGDVTTTAGSVATTIANNSVTLAKLADIATNSFIGRITAATGDPQVLTVTQATSLLNVFTSTLKGLAPASGGGTTNFLRADGTWAAPTASATWGSITGTLSTQTDLNTALNDRITFYAQDTAPSNPATGAKVKWLDTANWILYTWYSDGTSNQWVEYGPAMTEETATSLLTKLLTVDGATSGLDADLLDGQHGSYYTDIIARLGYTPLNTAAPTFTDTLTGPNIAVTSSIDANNLRGLGAGTSLNIYQPTTDGTDSGRVTIYGGGSLSNSRGAYILVHGNEYTVDPGKLSLVSGLNADIRLVAAGTGVISLDSDTAVSGTLSRGGNTVFDAGNYSPGTLTASTTNQYSGTTHTHAITGFASLTAANTFTSSQTVNVASGIGDWELQVAGVQAGGIFADTSTPRAVFYGSSGSTLMFRPNGRATVTNQMLLDTNGDLTVANRLDTGGTLRVTGISDPTTGEGLELAFTASRSHLLSYSRTSSVYREMRLYGSTVGVYADGSLGLSVATDGVSDAIGNLRDIPLVLRNSSTALSSSDRGKVIYKDNTTAYSWSLGTGVGTAGMAITILNAGTAGNVTITRSSVSLTDDTGTNADFVLEPNKSRTLYCISSTVWRVF